MSSADSFWYLACQSYFRKEVRNECTHRTHLHHAKLEPKDIRPKSKLMDSDSVSLIHDCGRAHVSTSSAANLVAERSQLRFVKEQIDYIMKKCAADGVNAIDRRSVVDELVAYLESR
ncbi:MAG: hypothetical protein ACREBR_02740 [bacterium]